MLCFSIPRRSEPRSTILTTEKYSLQKLLVEAARPGGRNPNRRMGDLRLKPNPPAKTYSTQHREIDAGIRWDWCPSDGFFFLVSATIAGSMVSGLKAF